MEQLVLGSKLAKLQATRQITTRLPQATLKQSMLDGTRIRTVDRARVELMPQKRLRDDLTSSDYKSKFSYITILCSVFSSANHKGSSKRI
jgi:hypothetical protein